MANAQLPSYYHNSSMHPWLLFIFFILTLLLWKRFSYWCTGTTERFPRRSTGSERKGLLTKFFSKTRLPHWLFLFMKRFPKNGCRFSFWKFVGIVYFSKGWMLVLECVFCLNETKGQESNRAKNYSHAGNRNVFVQIIIMLQGFQENAWWCWWLVVEKRDVVGSRNNK